MPNLDALNLANLIVETLKFHPGREHKSERLWDNVNVAKPGFINFHIRSIKKLNQLCAAVAETSLWLGRYQKT